MPKARSTTRKESNKKDLVVIVGDWVIDEYWLLARHHSRISSHTGVVHFRLAIDPDQEIVDLCGAGHVARVLLHLNRPHRSYDLIGLGNWNKEDTKMISHLAHARDNPDCHANSPGFTMNRRFCSEDPEISLFSLSPDGPTTRVVRQYHRQHGGIEQLDRIDWEAPGKNRNQHKLASLPMPRTRDVGRVLISVNDLRKGVVSSALISSLLRKYPQASWCVRSKNAHPEWLKNIGSRLELLVVGPEVAEQINPWGSWITHKTLINGALKTLAELPGRNVVLVSDQKEIAAKLDDGKTCLTARFQSRLSPLSELGLPTAIFGALTEAVLRNWDRCIGKDDLKQAIATAEDLAGVPLAKDVDPPTILTPTITPIAWKEEHQWWGDARKDRGLIKKSNELHLDVWRGSTTLSGYVACVRKKVEIIKELGEALHAFKKDHHNPQRKSLGILIRADPGAGKTYLAKRLAKAFDFSFLRFDITQMLHRDDLLELFDSVATQQANDSSDALVFVDEINASLDASPVYGAFLSPLEEGAYARRGSSFSLKPCVWLFVGTGKKEDSEKLSDFESRMTFVRNIDFDSLRDAYKNNTKDLRDEARLEQIYLGAIMIHEYYPDVTDVSEAVLTQFYDLDPATSPARRIRRMCYALKDVQYGMVSRRNCDEWKEVSWKGDEKRFVRLNF